MDLSSFSTSYAQAREKFLQACATRGLHVQSHIHPERGMQGEELAVDVAQFGRDDAPQLMVLSSGCHGVEGFCGSAVQIDLLRDPAWHEECNHADLAVLYIHALNPYGFSWLRRVTHENVDLNRNFRSFDRSLENNAAYSAIASLLLPGRCPPTWGSSLALLWHAARHGRKRLQQAVSRGQDVDPNGLFYAGREPTWSHRAVRAILREHAQHCERIGWIDVHTGLGPRGVGERIYKGRTDTESIARARQWWGDVRSSAEGNSSSAVLDGTLDCAVMADCPQVQYNGLTLEFGTVPGLRVLNALRAEQWLQLHPQTTEPLRQRIKQQLKDAFHIDADDWKTQILTQAREVMRQTLNGLTRLH